MYRYVWRWEFVCAIMPVAQRATCVGLEKIESELEAINLTFPCHQIWFGAEYIYSLHMLCFSLHSLLLFSLSLSPSRPSFFPIHRYRFRCGELHFTLQPFKWSLLFPPPCCSDYPLSMWMNSAVFLPECWLTWYLQLCSLLYLHFQPSVSGITQMWIQWQRSLLETALLYKVGKRNHRPWQVCLDVFISYATLQSTQQHGKWQFSKNK